MEVRTGKKIPEGVALDKFGKPTTDAKKALAGVQLPIAGFFEQSPLIVPVMVTEVDCCGGTFR